MEEGNLYFNSKNKSQIAKLRYVLNFFFLPRVGNIDLLTTLGWHQGKVEEDTQNIFQIKGLNYGTGFTKFHRHLDAPLSPHWNKLPFLPRKKTTQCFLQSELYGAGSYLYFEILCIVCGRVCCLDPTMVTLILRFLNFGCTEQTVKENYWLSELQQQCSYINLLLSCLFYIARDQYSSFSQCY